MTTTSTADFTAEQRLAQAIARSGPAALTELSPCLVAIGAGDATDLTDPAVLLEPVARVTPIVNPLLDALLDVAGARRSGARTYAFPMGKKSDPSGLTMLLNALPAGVVRHHPDVLHFPQAAFTYDYPGSLMPLRWGGRGSVPDSWARDRALTAAMDRHEGASHPRGPLSRFAVSLEAVDKQLYVRVLTRGLVYDPSVVATSAVEVVGNINAPGAHDLGLFTPTERKDPVRVTPVEAVAVAEWLAAAGYPLADLGRRGALADLQATVRRSVVAARVPGAPGLAHLVAGADIDVAAIGAPRPGSVIAAATVDAGAALQTVSDVEVIADMDPACGVRAAIDPQVSDVGRMLLAEPVSNPLLRPYQQQAVAVQRATRVGLLNALAPGLGKTVVTLTGMRLDAEESLKAGQPYRAVVAVPAAIRTQWAREAGTWFPEAKVLCVRTGSDAEKLADLLASAGASVPVLVITSYQLLAGVADVTDVAVAAGYGSARAFLDARDADLPEDAAPVRADLAEVLARTEWDHVVVDEAALVLRNPGSKRYQALWEMRRNSGVALALTGTPVDKSLDDLGRLLSWTRNDADLFYGRRLAERYDVLDGDSLTEFGKAVGPLVFRRDRSEVADELPEVVTEVVVLEGRPDELELANAARTELKRIYLDLTEKMAAAEEMHPDDPRYTDAKEALKGARGAMLGGVTLARMAASDPEAVADSDSGGAMLLRSQGLVAKATRSPGTKRTQIVDLVVDLVGRGEQVLIFTDFASVARNLVADLTARKLPVGAVLGGQKDKDRDAMVSGYQAGTLKVLVATSAAREGMNLQATTTLIHYDLPWQPSAVVQRLARANRIGAKASTLQVLIPVMAGTIEERVTSLLVARAATAMSALDGVRGAEVKGTEMGLALGGLVDAVNDAEVHGHDSSLLDMARSVLA